jgi:hypothetical protein
MKFGVDFSRLEDYVISMANQYPTFSYSTVAGGQAVPLSAGFVDASGKPTTTIDANSLTLLALDFNGGTAAGRQAYSSYSQTTGNRTVNFSFWETSLFAQDEFHVTPKLTLSPGLRFEHSGVPQPSVCNPAFPQTCTIPSDHNNSIAPRVGFAYALNDKTSIRGGYGVFYNRYITSSIENLFVTNGVYQNSYSFSGSNINATTLGCLPSFPLVQPFDWTPSGGCAQTLKPGILYADSSYRPSYSQQADVAIERELARNVSLSVSYVWSRSLHLPVSYDTNVATPTQTRTYNVMSSSDLTAAPLFTYTTPIITARNPSIQNGTYTGRVSILQSAANSYYNAALVNLKYRRSKWFQGDVSYTYGHTIDWGVGAAPTFGSTTPSSYENGCYRCDKGSSTLDRRHNLIVNYVFSPTFMNNDSALAKYVVNGWQLSGVTQFASSQPLVPTISGTISGVLSSFSINGLGGSSRVPFESTSALDIGPIYRTDARLAKNFPITERVNVTLGFEAFNIFNHLIPSGRDAAQYQFVAGTGAQAGQFFLTPRSSYGAVTLTQITPDGTTARRAQALIRINF